MIFYFVQFEHKETNKKFHKFGITSNFNKRFSSEYDERYNDFNITLLNSIESSTRIVETIEQWFLNNFPKNLYLESYLGVAYGVYDNMAGITEIVLLSDEEIKHIYDYMDVINKSGLETPSYDKIFITANGYLSIPKKLLDSFRPKKILSEFEIPEEYLLIEGDKYSTKLLIDNITYDDNPEFYRWSYNDFRKCLVYNY